MEKDGQRWAWLKDPRVWLHLGGRLLACAGMAAVMFLVGMVIGGLLQQRSEAAWIEGGMFEMMFQEGGNEMDKRKTVDAPFIDQRGKYPTGCESVTMVMALQHAGVDVTVEEFIDGYLPQGAGPRENGQGGLVSCDPNKAFMGTPYSEDGWGCYAPVIRLAADKLLEGQKSSLRVRDAGGSALEELCETYIEQGVPVVLWATMYMEPPRSIMTLTMEDTGGTFNWISPEHCLLLVGEDEGRYYFNDPLAGKEVGYAKAAVEAAYEAQGRQALVLAGHSL